METQSHSGQFHFNYYSDCYSSYCHPGFKIIGREFCQNKIDTGVGHGIVILF
jgi:hypothetical protein